MKFNHLVFSFKLSSIFSLLKRRMKGGLVIVLKYIHNNNNTYLGKVLLEKCVTKMFLKVELGKLKFELFYLSKVILGSERIKILFNQLNLRQKPCYPVRGEKEDLTHRYQKKNSEIDLQSIRTDCLGK